MGLSLVIQWLRIHLLMQGTWVRSLVWEGLNLQSNKVHVLQLLKPVCPRIHGPQQERLPQ